AGERPPDPRTGDGHPRLDDRPTPEFRRPDQEPPLPGRDARHGPDEGQEAADPDAARRGTGRRLRQGAAEGQGGGRLGDGLAALTWLSVEATPGRGKALARGKGAS